MVLVRRAQGDFSLAKRTWNMDLPNADVCYQELLQHILQRGELIQTRNALCYRSLVDHFCFEKTPLVSVRRTAWKNALREWQWFLSGSSKVQDLHPSVRAWWEPWQDQVGEISANYSEQFRHYMNPFEPWGEGFDQIKYLLEGIREHPYSRRNVITTWNTAEMAHPSTPITNCHGTIIQAFVDLSNKLHLVAYQRSVDVVVGLPHNWLQYWAFLLWLAHWTNRQAGSLTWIGGDVHVYQEHEELAMRMLESFPKCQETPELEYTPSSEEFLAGDFSLRGEYTPVLEEKARMVV